MLKWKDLNDVFFFKFDYIVASKFAMRFYKRFHFTGGKTQACPSLPEATTRGQSTADEECQVGFVRKILNFIGGGGKRGKVLG